MGSSYLENAFLSDFSFHSQKLASEHFPNCIVKIFIYLSQLCEHKLSTFLWSRLAQVQGTPFSHITLNIYVREDKTGERNMR